MDEVIPFPGGSSDPGDTALSNSRLSRDNLVEYQEDLLVKNARKILPALFKSLKERVAKNDSKAADQILQLYGYIKSQSGVMVNILNQGNGSQGAVDGMYFESIIKKMEKHDRPTVIEVEAQP